MRKSIVASFVVCATVAAGSNAHAQFSKPSPKQQIELGKNAAKELRQKEKVLPATDIRVKTLRRVATRLLSNVKDKTNWEYSFDVIDSKEVNAFALPGGPVFFYTGILSKMKTEDELAGVLGHELTHIRHEHWAKQYRDSQTRDTLVAIGALIFKAGRTVTDLAGLASGLFSLKYSRGSESDADDTGFDLVAQSGYNPQGMANVFRMLEAEQKGDKPPEFLSTHPSDKHRIQKIEDKIKKSGVTYPPLRPMKLSG